MRLCERCHSNPASHSAVIGGKFYKDICNSCNFALNPIKVSSGAADWERSIDAQDHEADIQQPYNSDGSINTRFIKLYPKQAAAIFSQEQMDTALRR